MPGQDPEAPSQWACGDLLDAMEATLRLLDPQLLLREILDWSCNLVGADLGSIGTIDEERRIVRIAAARGLPDSAVDVDIPWGLGLAGEVARLGGPVRLDRYGHLPRPMFQKLLDHPVLGMPVHAGGRLAVYLGLGRSSGPPFGQSDENLLQIYCRFVAVALENASLFVEARDQAVASERRRLRLEIHDSVLGKLSAARLFALRSGRAPEPGAEELKQRARHLLDLIQDAARSLRLLLQELRPRERSRPETGRRPAMEGHTDLRQGLETALDHLCEAMKERGLGVTFLANRYLPQPLETEAELYAIAQEALTNVLRHAGAREATVILSQDAHWVDLRIIDDGCGWDVEGTEAAWESGSASDGLGLHGMRERASRLHGEFNLHSRTGGGTVVEVIVPARKVSAL